MSNTYNPTDPTEVFDVLFAVILSCEQKLCHNVFRVSCTHADARVSFCVQLSWWRIVMLDERGEKEELEELEAV